MARLVALVLASVLLAPAAFGQAGTLDPTFGDGGRVIAFVGGTEPTRESAADVALLPDGRFVIVGSRRLDGNDFFVARYLPEGQLDPAFGDGGTVTLPVCQVLSCDDGAQAVAVRPDGRVVVAGYTTRNSNVDDIVLLGLLADGTLDPSFGNGGIVASGQSGLIRDLAVQPDGRLVVVGDDEAEVLVARYLPDGTPDPSFGAAGRVRIGFESRSGNGYAVAVRPDGRIVLGGNVTGGGGSPLMLAQLTPAGALDPTFGTGGLVTLALGTSAVVNALAFQPDGGLVAAGRRSDQPEGFAFLRCLPDGMLDPAFSGDGLATVTVAQSSGGAQDVTLTDDGRIVATGRTVAGSQGAVAVVRLLADGAADPAFGTGGVATVDVTHGRDAGTAVVVQPGGRALAVGGATIGQGSSTGIDVVLVRLTTGGAPDPTFGDAGRVVTALRGDPLDVLTDAVIQPDGRVVAAGQMLPHGAQVWQP